ncbi:hypothetical protein NC652_020841 [Populus alba x Populus x berolinensis]|nr:hypothetical protein NC652_020841 [Populus alba x Populus x berolinensis]
MESFVYSQHLHDYRTREAWTKKMGVASQQIKAARRSSARIFLSETGHDHGDVRYGRKSHKGQS